MSCENPGKKNPGDTEAHPGDPDQTQCEARCGDSRENEYRVCHGLMLLQSC